ncbi:ATP-binding protein [Mycolicibacterium madagascariense]|nr:ATP-binding protein [Mycolicibacterium madagascariense]
MNDLAPASKDAAAAAGAGADSFRRAQNPADADTVARVRADFGGWLARHCPPAVTLHHDVLLAVNEALANAAEHAYPGSSGIVDLLAHHDSARDALSVTVQDYGSWRPPTPTGSMRGRGLLLMRALADEAVVETSSHGTVVRLTWHDLHRRPAG